MFLDEFVQLFVFLAFLQSLLFRFSSRCRFLFNHGRFHRLVLSFDEICLSINSVSIFLKVDHSDLTTVIRCMHLCLCFDLTECSSQH